MDDEVIQLQNWRIKIWNKKRAWKIQVCLKAKFTLILDIVSYVLEKRFLKRSLKNRAWSRLIMHLSLETPTPHPGETWGIRQLKEKKEEKAPP